MTSTGAHLPSGQSSEIDMRPLLFDGFAVCPPNTFREVEGIVCLTGSTVTRKMEFWDQVGELEVINIQVRVVLGKTFEMMNRPFASNVVRNHDVTNSDVFEYRRNDVVSIKVPRQLSGPPHQGTGAHVPFSFL